MYKHTCALLPSANQKDSAEVKKLNLSAKFHAVKVLFWNFSATSKSAKVFLGKVQAHPQMFALDPEQRNLLSISPDRGFKYNNLRPLQLVLNLHQKHSNWIYLWKANQWNVMYHCKRINRCLHLTQSSGIRLHLSVNSDPRQTSHLETDAIIAAF